MSISSEPGYFDFIPPLRTQAPLFDDLAAMGSSKVHCLDAFHSHHTTPYELPRNAHMYEKRALPPLPPPSRMPPTIPRASFSFDASRASTELRPRISHTQPPTPMSGYENRPLPPLPTLQDSPSFESERRPSAEVEPLAVPSRPRAHRNISFRSFISRSHFPSPPAGKHESVFSNATTASFSSIDSVCSDDSHNDFSSNASTAPSTAPSSRRPSALSFSRKTEKESKRPASRKGSTASQSPRRRGLFGGSFTEEEVPPMPPTPATPAPAEFTCRPCYYSSARNCPGFVIAGTHGQACENCNALGFFGAP